MEKDPATAPAAQTFASLALSPALQQVVHELGYSALTPIQAESIPLLLQGLDVVGQAKTGSGKTAAFALPVLEKLKLQRRQVQALVLCPTRELSAQVAREFRTLGRRHAGLHVAILSGGMPSRPQAAALEGGAHVVVGTPGRVLDHLRRGKLDLQRITTVVLDEADRMLDMGFQEEMEAILQELPKARQTAFFSATFPSSIAAMSQTYQRQAVRVTIDEAELAPADVRQLVYETEPDHKLKTLLWLMQKHRPESALIFCNFKAAAAELAAAMSSVGISAAALHGDLEQRDRDHVMATFRNGSIRALVATDVAARGIDVADLAVVFNYDLPQKPEVYVHRIGRTGRAGKTGLAISLATPRESRKIEAITAFGGCELERQTPPTAAELGAAAVEKKSQHKDSTMATLTIRGGRKDKLRPGDILGALTGEDGNLNAKDIGKIEIHDNLAYVAVVKNIAHAALHCLQNGRIKGRKFRVALATMEKAKDR